MFPISSLSGSTTIPSDATFWMPEPEDIDEEGVGGLFRGTWPIKDVPAREARRLMQQERSIAEIVGDLAATAEDFDRLAHAAEDGYAGYALTVGERAALDDFLSEDEGAALESLELGVAGPVCALATVHIIPVASCRGHPGARAWSVCPVVLFATTEPRAIALQPLVEATDCRFGIDAARPDLLAVQGRCVLDTMNLADAVMRSRPTFVQRRPPRNTQPGHARDQERLL